MATDDDTDETRRTESFLLGISSGWEEAAKWIKDRSVEAFAADKLDDAMRLKKLAADVAKESKVRRQQFENSWLYALEGKTRCRVSCR